MRKSYFVLLSLFLSIQVSAQPSYYKEVISFGRESRWNPVHVIVEEKTGSPKSFQIRFNANNSTYYPFLLKIDFVQLDNLVPKPPVREEKVEHGNTILYNFSKQVEDKGYGYNYSYSYRLQPSDGDVNVEFPYLIPLKEGLTVIAHRRGNLKFTNTFSCRPGDTVYCMRRGTVTAVPESETPEFRLSGTNCIEVRQADGTYMIYMNLKKTNAFVTPGKAILPGKPIGIVEDSSFLQVQLLRVSNLPQQTLIPLEIKYSTGGESPATFPEIEGKCESVFPGDVLARELKGRELKQVRDRK